MTITDIIAEVKAGREVPRCQLEYAMNEEVTSGGMRAHQQPVTA